MSMEDNKDTVPLTKEDDAAIVFARRMLATQLKFYEAGIKHEKAKAAAEEGFLKTLQECENEVIQLVRKARERGLDISSTGDPRHVRKDIRDRINKRKGEFISYEDLAEVQQALWFFFCDAPQKAIGHRHSGKAMLKERRTIAERTAKMYEVGKVNPVIVQLRRLKKKHAPQEGDDWEELGQDAVQEG